MNDVPNIGFLYYKDYYKGPNNTIDIVLEGIDKISFRADLAEKNRIIQQQRLYNSIEATESGMHFRLKTSYPGLLVGSGYMHGVSNEEDFKIGFYFDYTTGLPVIPGSSVKGILRNAFKEEHRGYVKSILQSGGFRHIDVEIIDEEKLENEIFDGIRDGKKTSMYGRDIFFDAVPVESYNRNKIFLADDYITPHRDALKNPVPIKFLKVLPNVVFEFCFDLKPGIISVDHKLALFKCILLDLGAGSKTNVGYGRFDEA